MRGSGSSGERRREPLATSWNRYAENLNVSLEALGRYRLRTALSTLGIVLGMAAVIAMLSVGEGARNDVLRQVEQLGLNNVIVRNRGFGDDPGLRLEDAGLLGDLLPGVAVASNGSGTLRRCVRAALHSPDHSARCCAGIPRPTRSRASARTVPHVNRPALGTGLRTG